MADICNPNSLDAIAKKIRNIPDFPQPGINFKDITPLLGDRTLFRECITLMSKKVSTLDAQKIIGLDARGFIFGAAIADRLSMGFVPIRKKGKLPFETVTVDYTLEYNTNSLELHTDAVTQGEKVVVIDDVLATGGTAQAAKELLTKQGADIVGFLFLMELGFLNGRKSLSHNAVHSLITY